MSEHDKQEVLRVWLMLRDLYTQGSDNWMKYNEKLHTVAKQWNMEVVE